METLKTTQVSTSWTKFNILVTRVRELNININNIIIYIYIPYLLYIPFFYLYTLGGQIMKFLIII